MSDAPRLTATAPKTARAALVPTAVPVRARAQERAAARAAAERAAARAFRFTVLTHCFKTELAEHALGARPQLEIGRAFSAPPRQVVDELFHFARSALTCANDCFSVNERRLGARQFRARVGDQDGRLRLRDRVTLRAGPRFGRHAAL